MRRLTVRRPHLPVLLGVIVLLTLGAAAWSWQVQQELRGPAGAARAEGHRYTNHLIHETSPYLLQHAHNPVGWYPWGAEAFAKAKQEQKPIFLSIGYSACHWCHVMERESFEDEGIAKLLNEHFVAIKVDREERPDLDELYMTAVQLMTGSGGWPMSTFLTPEAKPFYGGTYFPREAFAELLGKVAALWTDAEQRKQQIEPVAERLTRAIGQAAAQAPQAGSVSPALVATAAVEALKGFDAKNGGFGGAPKFPPALRLGLLLATAGRPGGPTNDERRTSNAGKGSGTGGRQRRQTAGVPSGSSAKGGGRSVARRPDPGGAATASPGTSSTPWGTSAAMQAVTLTLERMARGGMYDQVGGGFHRYSVDEKWLVPHFEKMLYDNALLAWVYLRAFQETRNPEYRRIATETLDFALRDLRDPRGGFWGTLDADSEGREGAFYLWTPAAVIATLGPTDGALFNRIYGITASGNFEGANIPNLIDRSITAWAKELKTPPATLSGRLDVMRAKLRTKRGERVHPGRDDKVLASWNGLMLRALALGYDVTGEERYRQAAEQVANFLLGTMGREGRLRHSYREGKMQPQSFLEDYSFVIVGLLEFHRATGAERWLQAAQTLAGEMGTEFWDEQAGTFVSTPRQHEVLLARVSNAEDNATPSGQSMAALALVQLARRTGDREAGLRAQRLLNTYATTMKRLPVAMPNMLLAAQEFFTPGTGVRRQASGVSPAKEARSSGRVQVTLVSPPSSVRPGQVFEVAVRFAIETGWHINAAKPNNPALIATRLELAAGPFQQVAVSYPSAETVRLGFSAEPLTVYTGTPVIRLRLKALAGAERAGLLRLRVRYQACSDTVCNLPAEVLVTAPLTGVKG